MLPGPGQRARPRAGDRWACARDPASLHAREPAAAVAHLRAVRRHHGLQPRRRSGRRASTLRDENAPPTDRARLFVAGPVIGGDTADAARANDRTRSPTMKPDLLKIRVDDNLGTIAQDAGGGLARGDRGGARAQAAGRRPHLLAGRREGDAAGRRRHDRAQRARRAGRRRVHQRAEVARRLLFADADARDLDVHLRRRRRRGSTIRFS